MLYGIFAGKKTHLSEIARSLNETIPLKKTIWRLSRNFFALEEKETVMENYVSLVKKQTEEDNAVIATDNSDITKPCSPMMEAIPDVRDGSTGEIKKGIILLKRRFYLRGKRCLCPFMKKFYLLLKKALSVRHLKIYAAYSHCPHTSQKPVSVHWTGDLCKRIF